jgi:TDG/mug DNA glycosylase family protein
VRFTSAELLPQAHFGRRGNRFYPALYRAGVLSHPVEAWDGYRDGDREYLLSLGIGITNLVPGATARADELTRSELVAGARSLTRRVPRIAPAVVAVLGITAYRIAFERPCAVMGRQPEDLGGAQLWIVPNPSGLNARARLDDLARAYREVATAAGIDIQPSAQCPLRPL